MALQHIIIAVSIPTKKVEEHHVGHSAAAAEHPETFKLHHSVMGRWRQAERGPLDGLLMHARSNAELKIVHS